jgi:hypothetical protein
MQDFFCLDPAISHLIGLPLHLAARRSADFKHHRSGKRDIGRLCTHAVAADPCLAESSEMAGCSLNLKTDDDYR